MDINPFVISQVCDMQNELIFSAASIDKAELLDHIYSFYDILKSKESFFRSFVMNGQIVIAYYWKTSIPEKDSGRLGLYVIIGFVIDARFKNIDTFAFYSTGFFRILEEAFCFSINADLSDAFFSLLQTEHDMEIGAVRDMFTLHMATLPIKQSKKAMITQRKKKANRRNAISYVYMLNDYPCFYENWTVFTKEAFSLIIDHGGWDVSTLSTYTPHSLIFLENGSRMPYSVSNAEIMQYLGFRYMKLT